jgi:hypothetical protein
VRPWNANDVLDILHPEGRQMTVVCCPPSGWQSVPQQYGCDHRQQKTDAAGEENRRPLGHQYFYQSVEGALSRRSFQWNMKVEAKTAALKHVAARPMLMATAIRSSR